MEYPSKISGLPILSSSTFTAAHSSNTVPTTNNKTTRDTIFGTRNEGFRRGEETSGTRYGIDQTKV